MKTRYYSVFDNVSKTFAPLFKAQNDEDARRLFARMIGETEKKDPFYDCEDTDLWYVCEFDDEKLTVSDKGLREIIPGKYYVPKEEEDDHAVVEKEKK